MHKLSFYLAAAGLSLVSTSASAQTASSSGYAVGVNQTVSAPGVANVNVTVGPLAGSSGSTSPDYINSAQVLSGDANTTLVLTNGLGGTSEQLQTGLLTSISTGTSTGAAATATVNNLSLGIGTTPLLGDPFLASLFGISATTIQSTSTASALGLAGSTTIEGLLLTGSALNGFTFNASLFVNPAPNTVLLDLGGILITLNEQIISGDSITTNAINVAFHDFALGTGLKNGNIILSSTTAAYTGAGAVTGAVPEPSTWAMMFLGFGAMGVSMRRRRRRTQGLVQVA